MTRRTVALAVVALALGWRLVAAVAGAAVELARPDSRARSLRERFAAFDEPLAARMHRSLGFADPIVAAVRAGVPEDAVLAIGLDTSKRSEILSMPLADLLWPRRIFLTAGNDLLAGVPPDARAAEHLYGLLLGHAAPTDPAQWDEVQGDPRFTLWRAKGPPR